MKQVTLPIAALLTAVLCLLTVQPAVAQGEGVLSGTVINLTEGGGSVAGLEVTQLSALAPVELAAVESHLVEELSALLGYSEVTDAGDTMT